MYFGSGNNEEFCIFPKQDYRFEKRWQMLGGSDISTSEVYQTIKL